MTGGPRAAAPAPAGMHALYKQQIIDAARISLPRSKKADVSWEQKLVNVAADASGRLCLEEVSDELESRIRDGEGSCEF